MWSGTGWNRLHYTAKHCNTLQHPATHCNTLQHTATHCSTLQHTATHSSTLQHTATHSSTLQHTATHHYALHYTVTRDIISILWVMLELVFVAKEPHKRGVCFSESFSKKAYWVATISRLLNNIGPFCRM